VPYTIFSYKAYHHGHVIGHVIGLKTKPFAQNHVENDGAGFKPSPDFWRLLEYGKAIYPSGNSDSFGVVCQIFSLCFFNFVF
jgi:hypothetical protein